MSRYAKFKVVVAEKLKGIVHPKMKILSSFTHPQTCINFLVLLNTKEDIWKNDSNQTDPAPPLTTIVFISPTMVVNGIIDILRIILFCVQQNKKNVYRFGTTWGWVNDDKIFFFGWTITLNVEVVLLSYILQYVSGYRLHMLMVSLRLEPVIFVFSNTS